MPLSYDIVSEAPQVRVVGKGAVTMSAMIAVFDRVAGDARFDPRYTVTFDLRAAAYTAELADGETLVAMLGRKHGRFHNRLALVVPESLHFLARLYCSLVRASGFDRIQCFTDLEQAEEWCRAQAGAS